LSEDNLTVEDYREIQENIQLDREKENKIYNLDIDAWTAIEIADMKIKSVDCLSNWLFYREVDAIMYPLAKRNLLTHNEVFGNK
jgi:hypothetical protein